MIDVVVVPAPDRAVIENLARYYVYDLAQYAGLSFGDDGALTLGNSIDKYFAADASPFLVMVDGKPAGFALVRRMDAVVDMGEFFVAGFLRGKGVGRRVAHDVFARFPGAWQVRELPANTPAQAFWRRVIQEKYAYVEAREKFPAFSDREFVVQRFEVAV